MRYFWSWFLRVLGFLPEKLLKERFEVEFAVAYKVPQLLLTCVAMLLDGVGSPGRQACAAWRLQLSGGDSD